MSFIGNAIVLHVWSVDNTYVGVVAATSYPWALAQGYGSYRLDKAYRSGEFANGHLPARERF